MALSYTAGKSLVPNHKGVFPPTDRLSVLTYWWGLEILLPPPTLAYLSRVHSISGTIMNVLTGLGVMYEGFSTIKAQDRGARVIMPAALVPRPWDSPTRVVCNSILRFRRHLPKLLQSVPVPTPTPVQSSVPPVSQPSSSE
ncbi:hypothetical protein BGY98DRAFT_980135, partial [Russula aff. rugulosa BPL654]